MLNSTIYSTVEEDNKQVCIEVDAGYVDVRSLLKAIEHSNRDRSRKPFVSSERSHYFPQRMAPKAPVARASTVEVGEQWPLLTETPPPNSGKSFRPLFDTFLPGEDAKSSLLPGPAATATTRGTEEERAEE